jgi:hypothetical protein
MKKVAVLSMVLLLQVSAADVSQAAFVVDTGEPPTGLPDPPFLDLNYAGEFTLPGATVITGIEHFMLVESAGLINLRIYGDGGDGPGGYIRATGNRYYVAGGPGWRGISGLDWALPAGTYWVAVEPQFGGTLVGRTYKGAPNPLLNEARTLWQGSPWYDIDSWDLGWRIEGTAAPGSDEEHPILPGGGGGGGAFLFEAVPGDGRWFDPPPAIGYVYETDGASHFVQVGLPVGVADADGLYTVSDGVNGSAVVAAGGFYAFATPVESFTVAGIDPAVDGGDPLAFPTFLQFDQSTVSFTMTPIPEPAALSLLLLGGIALLRRRARSV